MNLRPCPFCGGKARFEQTACGTTDASSCKLSFSIRCAKCSATAPNSYGYVAVNLSYSGDLNLWHDDRGSAIKAWNRRANDA